MTTALANALVALVITGIIGGLVKLYFDYKSKLMATVWEKRLEAYRKFFTKTALFPKYPPKPVYWKEVFQLSMDFRDWYFEGNGLFLSNTIRDHYFGLQKYLSVVTKERAASNEKLNSGEYDDLRERCSRLRSLMAKELESRESPIWHRFRKGPMA